MREISLRRRGSNYILVIPVPMAKAQRLKEGQQFEVSQENGRLVSMPVSAEFDAAMNAHVKVRTEYCTTFQKLADT